jgi:hypothetical protein
MLEGACCIVKGMTPPGEQEDNFPEARRGGLDRLIRVYGYVMAAIHKWKRKKGAAGPVLINLTRVGGRVIGYPSAECLRSVELFLLEQAQKGMKIPGAKQLVTDTITEEDTNGVKRKLVVIGSRGRNQIKGVYGTVDLPMLAKDHRLSELHVRAAHKEEHEGVIATLHRSRRKVWVTNGRALADAVRFRCTECRLKTKKCMEQRMGFYQTTGLKSGPYSSR